MKPTGLKKIKLQPVNAKTQHLCWVFEVPEAGVETFVFEQGYKALSESGGTPGGTLPDDPRLQAVVEAWPLLNERDRQTILKVIHTSCEQSQDG